MSENDQYRILGSYKQTFRIHWNEQQQIRAYVTEYAAVWMISSDVAPKDHKRNSKYCNNEQLLCYKSNQECSQHIQQNNHANFPDSLIHMLFQ